MRWIWVFLLATCLCPVGAAGADDGAAAPAAGDFIPLPTEVFAQLPFIEDAQLSPDGGRVAGLIAADGAQQIRMMDLEGKREDDVAVAIPDQTEVAWIRWVGNDNIIVGLHALLPVDIDNWYISRLIAINRTSRKITKLLWDLNGQNAADVLWIPSDGSTQILVTGQNSIYESAEFWPAVYRVDVTNGRKRIVERGRSSVLDWGADNRGQVRYAVGYRDHSTRSTLLYRSENDHGFKLIDTARLRDEDELDLPFHFLHGTDHGYMIRPAPDDRMVVAEVDLLTGEAVRTVHAEPDADIEGVLMSIDGTKMIGVHVSDRDRPVRWIDPVMAANQKALDAMSPNATARIISYSADLQKLLVRFSTPDNPGLLFYYDAGTGMATRLASYNEQLGAKRLSRAKFVTYRARDGLEIEAVLTMPRGGGKSNLPFVVMPHGGPWAHDDLGYDYWAQFLAERGYAVLQPNFRGSTGYGEAFLKAGQGQLGYAMQDDVSDGVRWAVAQGIADPKRVCIVGASYGGYAAMWGIAKDPDQYRCAISIAGVSNLRREVNDFGGNVRERLYRGQWQKMTPDFATVSPINAVDRIKAPLLLIHGKKDVTVDVVQSAKMYSAMVKAGKEVEYLPIPLADHYFTREADRLTLLTAIEAFLRKHNPPD
ncbi:Dipeptidyl aminopeptidase/acylaminoacyl peptidase [Sphingopyxis indica]|uniref:Dipeptidyl aminopeptidase/acylaminoacyl peptidase n=2 Tax=Sphingopyxis indica TaxID=436663 RepID=A0A239JF03_9SPHN|nr:Dipeptidyl aminopeptidase/acylaminoacyl peptidase [Sphingopyxis indica]